MKKPKRKNKKRRNNRAGKGEPRNARASVLRDIFDDLSGKKKQGWFFLFLFVFLFFFLGAHLIEAINTLGISNIRTTDTVLLSRAPVWFSVVLVFKAIFWVFSIYYIVLFLRKAVAESDA